MHEVHPDYKYRDSDSRFEALSMLIQQYSLKAQFRSKAGSQAITPEQLIDRMKKAYYFHSSIDRKRYSVDEREDLIFTTGSEHLDPAWWDNAVAAAKAFNQTNDLVNYGEFGTVSLSNDVQAILSGSSSTWDHNELYDDPGSQLQAPDTVDKVETGTEAAEDSDLEEPPRKRQRQACRAATSIDTTNTLTPGRVPIVVQRDFQLRASTPTPTSPKPEPQRTTSGQSTMSNTSDSLSSIDSSVLSESGWQRPSGEDNASRLQLEIATITSESVARLFEVIQLDVQELFTYDASCSEPLARLFRLCCGQNWIQTLDTFRTRRFLRASDLTTALLSAAVSTEILSEHNWMLQLCLQAAVEQSDYQDALFQAISFDAADHLRAEQLTAAISARKLRDTASAQPLTNILADFAATTADRILHILVPYIEVLVDLSKALNPYRKSFAARRWREVLTEDLGLIVRRAIELKLETYASVDHRYEFFWPASGDIFDAKIHRSHETNPNGQIAIALGPGLRCFAETSHHDMQTRCDEEKEVAQYLGCAEVITCAEFDAPEASASNNIC
ncbi:uncharacterized protein RHO25_011186 [Cercospora beticola]|nr:hypothetical protein RHO25_011186 [Cercospora beticola]